MKIIVTGALGHIGSKLIRDLPNFIKDLDIAMIDNFTTQRYSSLFNLTSSANYKFYEKDIMQDNLDVIFKNADVAIHLAALTEASASLEKPDEYERVNYQGTKNILDLCQRHSVKMIHFSSTSIYGTKKSIVDEDCEKEDINPQSPQRVASGRGSSRGNFCDHTRRQFRAEFDYQIVLEQPANYNPE